MADSGEKPGRLPEPAADAQIDTTPHRSKSRFNHGFQRFAHSFNRTLLMFNPYQQVGDNFQEL